MKRESIVGLVLLALSTSALRAQPGERIVTDYYEAQPTATGGLDFYSLSGERVINGMCLFRASYFFGGQYRTLVGNVAAFPEIRESSDSIQVSSVENLGIVAVTFRYTLVRHSPFVECRVVLNYQRDIDSVFYETVETGLSADSAWVVTRDRRQIPASGSATYVTDRWTTRGAQFGFGSNAVTFPGEDNMLAMRISYDQDRWLLTYDLDRDFDHPFFRNYNSFPGYNVYDTFANTTRQPETDSLFLRFAVGAQVPILKKECQPSGYQATLVMTEHADCEGPLTSLAIAFGSSAVDTPLPGRGILGNGLTWTKSVFRWHTFGGGGFINQGYYGLDRPDFKDVVDTLFRRGVEIGLHTPSAVADTITRVAATLRDMRNWYQTRTWIDHGMPYNPEDLSRFGTEPESTHWYSLDTLRDNGIDYVWQSIDMSGFGVYDNSLFVPGQTDFYPPILYAQPRLNHFGQARPMYLWPAWPINDNGQRDWQLGPGGITRLIQQRGIEILHLYFAAQDTTVHRYQPSRAEWLVPHWHFPYISWESDPWVDGYFQFIANCKQQGLLWVPTLSQLADYMLLMDSVTVRAQTVRQFAVTNSAACPIPGFALSVRAEGIKEIALDGQPVVNRKTVDDDILFWFDLPPDTTLILTLLTEDYAQSDQAMAPSQNPHLEYQAGVYHRVFFDQGTVSYQQSVDNGSNWSPAETVGTGGQPSLVLNDSGIPVVCFDSAGLLQAKRRASDRSWSAIPLALDTTHWQNAVCGGLAASRLNDSTGGLFYVVHAARRRSSPEFAARGPQFAVRSSQSAVARPSIRLAVFDTAGLLLDTMVCEATAGNSDTLPSIAVTRADILHIAWQQEQGNENRVFYRTTEAITPAQLRRGEPLVFSPIVEVTQPGTLCETGANPVICAFGDSATCVWQGPNELNQPVEEVWVRSRWLYDGCDQWSPALDLSQSPGQRSLNPVMRSRVCLWQEDVSPGNADIVGIAGADRFVVNSTPTQSVYPHLAARLGSFASQQARLGTLWADFVPAWHSWQVMFRAMDLPLTRPISYYEVGCGESLASPYCRHRDGAQQVGGHRIDLGSESLAYALPWLDPARNYQLLCRFYAPESDTLYQNLFINDSLFASFAIPPGRSETLLLSVPPSCYAGTGSIKLKLTSEAFALIVLEGVTVFESEEAGTGEQERKGGSQGSSSSGPQSAGSLWISSGNPATGAVTIRYQLGRPDFVKLSLFDIAGRQVQKLVDGYHLAGNYSVRVSDFGFRASRLRGGVYIFRLETSSGAVNRKLLILR